MDRTAFSFVAVGFALLSGRAQAQVAAPTSPPPVSNTDAATTSGPPDPAPPPKLQSPTVGEIVVTAQRRSENLQNVPISVTAVTATQLANAGVSGTQDLSLVVPGLSLEASLSDAMPRIRGVGASANGPGIENPVSIYVDGVYIAASVAGLLNFNNVSQVEVLKGPQGTLFGRNATGGLIQISTPDPTDRPRGDIAFTYANYDTSRVDFYGTRGITDGLSADLAGYIAHQGDGYGTDVAIDKPTYKTDRDMAFRSKFLWTPAASTQVRLQADYENTRSDPSFRILAGTKPLIGSDFVGGPWDTNENYRPAFSFQGGGLSLNIKQDLGFAQLTSISAYRRSQSDNTFDFDGTPLNVAYFPALLEQDQQFSQELQLSSVKSKVLTWTAGIYYFSLDARFNPNRFDFGPAVVTAQNPLTEVEVLADQRSNAVAGYVQGTLAITSSTHLTLGGRYSYEHQGYQGDDFGFVGSGVPIGALFPKVVQSTGYTKPTWRIALDQRFGPELLGYISFNHGYKTGGFNVSDPTNRAFLPEELDAYEAGFKADLFSRRLRLNASGFYYLYKDIQVARFTTGPIEYYNGAKAKIYGFDLDTQFALTNDLRLTGGLELLHDRFADFPNAEISHALPTGGYFETLGSAEGNRLPFSPDADLSASLDYKHDFGSGRLSGNVTYGYNAGWYTEPDNYIRQRPFSSLNVRGSFLPETTGLELSIWAKNLFDNAVLAQGSTFGFFDAATYNPPRTFGFTIKKSFGGP